MVWTSAGNAEQERGRYLFIFKLTEHVQLVQQPLRDDPSDEFFTFYPARILLYQERLTAPFLCPLFLTAS